MYIRTLNANITEKLVFYIGFIDHLLNLFFFRSLELLNLILIVVIGVMWTFGL
jgi:hypothetical protein